MDKKEKVSIPCLATADRGILADSTDNWRPYEQVFRQREEWSAPKSSARSARRGRDSHEKQSRDSLRYVVLIADPGIRLYKRIPGSKQLKKHKKQQNKEISLFLISALLLHAESFPIVFPSYPLV